MSMRGGQCQCGATRYQFDAGKIRWQGLCHCRDCQRATGAPVVGWLGIRDGHWHWVGREPARYASSAGVERGFCRTCGTPLSYASDRWPGETHFLAATLDDPADYAPAFHVYTHFALPWARIDDTLPKHSGTVSD